MNEFYSNGLYIKPFFKQQRECDIAPPDGNFFEAIDYNFELFADYHKDNFDWEDEDELKEQVDEFFFDYLTCYSRYFEPLIFDENIAFECDLTPFTKDNLNYLSLCGGMDLMPKLDAYQALIYKKIDKDSYLFKDFKYFEFIVGKELTQKVIKAIS